MVEEKIGERKKIRNEAGTKMALNLNLRLIVI